MEIVKGSIYQKFELSKVNFVAQTGLKVDTNLLRVFQGLSYRKSPEVCILNQAH